MNFLAELLGLAKWALVMTMITEGAVCLACLVYVFGRPQR